MELLPTIWFIAIAVLWTGYLFLEGFDLGVGMLMKLFARNNTERRVLLNTIGPVWDGNEVWLLTAGGATFAAFPLWYASLFSALYLPLLVVLLALIFRAVAFEYRGKVDTDSWRNRWDWAIALGSFLAAFGVGAALALTTTGLPLNANGDRAGGPMAWFSGYALLGGLAVMVSHCSTPWPSWHSRPTATSGTGPASGSCGSCRSCSCPLQRGPLPSSSWTGSPGHGPPSSWP